METLKTGAVERYKENAEYIRKAIKAGEYVAGSERVAAQFETQAKDAQALAELFDNADSVTVDEATLSPVDGQKRKI